MKWIMIHKLNLVVSRSSRGRPRTYRCRCRTPRTTSARNQTLGRWHHPSRMDPCGSRRKGNNCDRTSGRDRHQWSSGTRPNYPRCGRTGNKPERCRWICTTPAASAPLTGASNPRPDVRCRTPVLPRQDFGQNPLLSRSEKESKRAERNWQRSRRDKTWVQGRSSTLKRFFPPGLERKGTKRKWWRAPNSWQRRPDDLLYWCWTGGSVPIWKPWRRVWSRAKGRPGFSCSATWIGAASNWKWSDVCAWNSPLDYSVCRERRAFSSPSRRRFPFCEGFAALGYICLKWERCPAWNWRRNFSGWRKNSDWWSEDWWMVLTGWKPNPA